MIWHSRDKDEVFEEVDSSESGLSSEEANKRLEDGGKNEIESGESVSPIRILINQFNDFLIYLLVLAALISLGIGFLPGHSPEYTDAALIFLILIANGLFGFIQDYKAEESIKALKDLSTPSATVMRDGEKQQVDSRNIVPGDVIFIEQGDAVPADARVIESQSLETDEAALTGESSNVSKKDTVLEEDTALAEQKNMIFKNTTAVKGRGKAVVVETGMDTQVGDIASQIEEADDKKTPFQKEVDELGRTIGYAIIGIIALVAFTQLWLLPGSITAVSIAETVPIILVAVTLAVAAVPEGLPAVVTLTLALGSKKMLKKNALVRRLPVVESLGSVDVIVTDKTGTLTEGVMTVKNLFYSMEEVSVTGTGTDTEGKFKIDENEIDTDHIKPLLECGVKCNNAEKAPESEEENFYGEPTEISLLVSGYKAGIKDKGERVREIPFSSDRKRMTVLNNDGMAYMKGAPEVVLERCNRILLDGEVKDLTEERRNRVLDKNHEFAEEALRVLGFAHKEQSEYDADTEEVESDMIFLGLQGMIDPPREEVNEAVDDCRNAGIKTVMATGDNVETAKAIGEQIGFSTENALTGSEVEDMSESELSSAVTETEIFARVSPKHKVDISKALQNNKHNVAMTGDGVNDAPALKNSDVGIAMGDRGTDVAKQSADMILQDDNFVTIRDAIAEGRGIFDNIRKFVNYLLSANAGEVLVVFFGVMLGSVLMQDRIAAGQTSLILTPVMLLWMNFVTDGLPALALGTDPKSDGIMKRSPRGSDEPVINKRMMGSIFGIGCLMTVVGLPLFFYVLGQQGIIAAQTTLFTFLVLIEMVRIQLIRSRYDLSIVSNNWLVSALVSSVVLQLLVVYTPLSSYFGTARLGVPQWAYMIGALFAFIGLASLMRRAFDRVFTAEK